MVVTRRALATAVDAVKDAFPGYLKNTFGRRQAAWPVTTSILAGALTHQNCYPS